MNDFHPDYDWHEDHAPHARRALIVWACISAAFTMILIGAMVAMLG